MIHFEREVLDYDLIAAMLDYFQDLTLALNDTDGFPYQVPLNFGYEMDDENLTVYVHFMKRGKKLDLMRKDPRCSLQFHKFNDFPDCKYKGHYHDYRSVTAKGLIEIIDASEDYETFEHGYILLMSCSGREPKPLSERKSMPQMFIGKIVCPLSQVSAKSEFPLRTVEDVPFIDVYSMPEDSTPFDLSDIIAKRRQKN